MAKAGETGGVSSLWASAGAASESRQAPVASAAAAVDGVAAKSLVALASAIDDMAGTVLSGAISDEELVGSVGVLRRLEAVMAAERYRRVAEVDARCAYRVAGAGSTETWLSEAQQVARSDAAVEVTVARALLELPATAGMLARGEIDEARARVVGTAWREVARETAADAEDGPVGASGDDRQPDGGAAPGDGPPGGAGGGNDAPGESARAGGAGAAGRGPDDGGGAPVGEACGPGGPGVNGDGGGEWSRADEDARVAAAEAARDRNRAAFDKMVAGQAGDKDRHGVSRGVRRWRDRQDPDRHVSRAKRAHRRRDLWIATQRDADGTTLIKGKLDDAGVAKLRAAVDALSRPAQDAERAREDKRTPGQRRADALVALAERSLDAGDLPWVARQRPHVLMVTSPEGLHGIAGATAPHLDGVGDIAAATAQMLCCDASIGEVTIRNGEVLDAKPRQMAVSARQRDAVLARDRRCVGCGARAALCQIHHIVWLSRGGTHDLSNLVLVCYDCHFHIHHLGWRVARHGDGGYRLDRPPKLRSSGSLGEDANGDDKLVGGDSATRRDAAADRGARDGADGNPEPAEPPEPAQRAGDPGASEGGTMAGGDDARSRRPRPRSGPTPDDSEARASRAGPGRPRRRRGRGKSKARDSSERAPADPVAEVPAEPTLFPEGPG